MVIWKSIAIVDEIKVTLGQRSHSGTDEGSEYKSDRLEGSRLSGMIETVGAGKNQGPVHRF